jgi:hypothetical protein
MDKGYDSEAIHRLIREDLHADSIIPIRSWNNEFVGGIYRQEMALRFDDVRYRKRQLVENAFSVLKRKFSGDLKARIFSLQMKEITGKMIVCNLHRFLQFLVFEVFYKAEILKIAVENLDYRSGTRAAIKAIAGPIISPAQNRSPRSPTIPNDKRSFLDSRKVERAMCRIQIPSMIGMKARISVTITPAERPVSVRTWTIWTSKMDAPPK